LKKIAYAIRICTLPPFMALLALCIASLIPETYVNKYDMLVAAFCLAIVPVSVYPLQRLIKPDDTDRQFQRRLAFVVSIIGYAALFLYAILASTGIVYRRIALMYLLSVVLLATINKTTKLRASGHGCSVTAPFLVAAVTANPILAVTCFIMILLDIWASLKLKRHTLLELISGMSVCVVSFLLSLLLITI